jgi:hypothetical protein
MVRNQIYIPANKAATALCGTSNGCIAVFTAPNDDKCLAQGMPVLDHDDGDDPVFMRTRCRDHDRDDRVTDRRGDRRRTARLAQTKPAAASPRRSSWTNGIRRTL